jgi:hypothetical protein
MGEGVLVARGAYLLDDTPKARIEEIAQGIAQ